MRILDVSRVRPRHVLHAFQMRANVTLELSFTIGTALVSLLFILMIPIDCKINIFHYTFEHFSKQCIAL